MTRGRLLCVVMGLVIAGMDAACHSGPAEPRPPTPPDATSSGERRVEAHRVVAGDHRHVIPLRVGDLIVAPDDTAFDWRIDLEDTSAFATAAPRDGAAAYRVTKAGPLRIMVYGDPKCLNTDAACGLSKRRWDITLRVD